MPWLSPPASFLPAPCMMLACFCVLMPHHHSKNIPHIMCMMLLVSHIVLLLLQHKETLVRRTLQTYAVWPHSAMVKSTTNLFCHAFCCWQAFHLPWIKETVVTLQIKSCVNPTPAALPALSWQHPWCPIHTRCSVRMTTSLGRIPRQLPCVRLSTTVLQQSSYGRAACGVWSTHSKRVSP